MAYTFLTSPLVAIDQPIRAIEHWSCSKAFNDRLLSGLGDGTRRIHQYVLGLFRQVRNPSETGLWPANAEWSEFYSYISSSDALWPGIDAGDWEGANLANPAMAFVFGNPQLSSEGDRLTDIQLDETPNAINQWEIAKYQRGGYDLTTGNMSAPMIEVAQSHSVIVQPRWSFHGKSYGGYTPIPKVLGTCWDGIYETLNLQYKFTRLSDGHVTLYPGSCGPDAGGTTADVMGVYEYPFSYKVYLWDGSEPTTYPKSEYIEGPYDGGGYLSRRNGDQINRLMLQPFLKDFRGTPSQRSGSCYNLMEVAADYQYFFESQYQLAPAYATTVGGNLSIEYPYIQWNGNMAAGLQSPIYSTHPGYVLGGYLIQCSGAAAPFKLQLYENDTLTNETLIHPTSSAYVFTHPSGSQTFFFRVSSSVASSGSLYIEYSELLEYKPQHYDAYALMRIASAQFPAGDDFPDKYGKTTDAAASIINYYKQFGSVFNINDAISVDGQFTVANTNPVLESCRQHIQDWLRVVARSELAGYEVVDGKSILHFRRHNKGLDNDLDLDTFEGIHEGIHAVAPTASFSNEWVMDVNFKMYGGTINDPDDVSEWKTSVYGDYFPFIQRCHLLNPQISAINNPDMFQHFMMSPSEGSINTLYRSRLFAPEALSAYIYAKNSNYYIYSTTVQQNFYRSCQIYPEPYYIESASLYEDAGVEYVKLQFDRRFQSCSVAPASITKDHTTWVYADIQSEPYRTDENGIREYIMANAGYGEALLKTGDTAVWAEPASETGNMHGSIIPHFFFTKLIPTPYMTSFTPTPENTGSIDTDKTIVDINRFQQMEVYLRSMCEGYVDGTRAASCYDEALEVASSAWDYTWENLNYDAHGGNWLPIVPLAIRPDEPQGYGPLPNTKIYAAWHNQMALMINLLKMVRVPLPYELLCNSTTYTGYTDIASEWPTGLETCDITNVKAISFDVSMPAATTAGASTGWAACAGSIVAQTAGGWAGNCGVGDTFRIESTRTVTSFKFQPVDSDAYLAMSDDLYNMYISTGNAFFGRIADYSQTVCAIPVENQYEAASCKLPDDDDNYFWWDAPSNTGYRFESCPSDIDTLGCVVVTNGTIDAGSAPPTTDLYFGYNGPLRPCYEGSQRTITIVPVSTYENIVVVGLI